MTSERWVDVAPFLPVRGSYTYAVPDGMLDAPAPGCRVVVPFGRREVIGVVLRSIERPASVPGEVRPLRELLDLEPVLPRDLLDLLLFAASYYFAPIGEVVRAALPVLLHGREQCVWRLTDSGRAALAAQQALLRTREQDLSGAEARLLGELERRGGRWNRPKGRAGSTAATVARLLARGFLAEDVRRREAGRGPQDLLLEVVDDGAGSATLVRSPRQAELWRLLVEAGGSACLSQLHGAPRDGRALARRLAEKGLVRCRAVDVVRNVWGAEVVPPDVHHQLTDEQQAVVRALSEAAERKAFEPFLLHGVTGSGKTEVYLRLIEVVLALGRQALVLVPEIALTPQLAGRFRARFGDDVAVLHSGLSDNDRYDQWRRIRRGQVRIVVGARSAVFAPLDQLGVVIVDEEHDGSFKQQDGARYNARDLALWRAQRAGALTVLGSATPSLESYDGAQRGRLKLLELCERPTAQPLPTVDVIDLRVYKTDAAGLLSAPLADAVEQTLAVGQQTILFHNRRGFSPFVACKGCGHVFRCEHCSVSLTHHRRRNRLMCHYCGFTAATPERCPACGGEKISMLGSGTERVEQAIQERFPAARVARLDRDTAAGAGLMRLLERVRRREVDILVGTQMVTKGHDFPEVTLVGVLCADLGLHFPDFRAAERTFQLLTQVAGRAGRGGQPGRVVIQTYNPEHPVVRAAQMHNYGAFYARETRARGELGYPPYGYLAALHVDGSDAAAVAREIRRLTSHVRGRASSLGVELLGPVEAPLQRLKGRVRWMVLLKGKQRSPMRSVVELAQAQREALTGDVRLTVDIDPLNMM